MHYLEGTLDYIGGITLMAWRVIKLIARGRIALPLLFHQMVILGVNSIPITMLVLGFGGAVFGYVLADEMVARGAGSLVGGILLKILLREVIPLFTGGVLAGKIGAAVTSELGTMKISEQLDALRALSTDPDWFLTAPRVLAGVIMTPVIAVFGGYAGWFCGYWMANQTSGLTYLQFQDSVRLLVDNQDIVLCFVKSAVIGATIVLTACHFGYRAKGGAAGVGRVVTTCVVVNVLMMYVLDLLLTMGFDWTKQVVDMVRSAGP